MFQLQGRKPIHKTSFATNTSYITKLDILYITDKKSLDIVDGKPFVDSSHSKIQLRWAALMAGGCE